jgi:predicted nucleic acid-binding protein
VDWLLLRPIAGAVAARVVGASSVHVVDMIYVEVVSAFRQIAMRGELTSARGDLALETLAQLRLRRHSTRPLSRRMWELRSSHGAYDAAYIALAEALDGELVTTDVRLARSRGHRARIVDMHA